MKTAIVAVAAVFWATGGVAAEDPAEGLTRGKLEADLGHYSTAAAAFSAVVEAPGASDDQRWEALVRLGAARLEAGDPEGSADAFEEAWTKYGGNPEALRFLLQGVGCALPGQERWNEVWSELAVEVDRPPAKKPVIRVTWPGMEPAAYPLVPARHPRSGTTIDLDLKDADFNDVLRLFADTSGQNIVVMPRVRGSVTFHAEDVPWEEALEAILAPSGYIALHEGNVTLVCRPEDAPTKRAFVGRSIDLDYQDVGLVQVLREVAGHGGVRVEIPDGVIGKVYLKLVGVPWDQAFDLLTHVNGLTWTRAGDVIRVEPRNGGPSR
jgi:hypothetical protein